MSRDAIALLVAAAVPLAFLFTIRLVFWSRAERRRRERQWP